MIPITVSIAVLAAMVGFTTASSPPRMDSSPKYEHRPDACEHAFRRCNFRFQSSLHAIPTFHITGPPDKVFSPRITWKNRSKLVGIVNSNLEGAFITPSGKHVPFSHFHTGTQRFTRTQFKPYTIVRKHPHYSHYVATPYSGIGHEVFQGNRHAAENKCVLIRITHYQILDGHVPPNVSGNINGVKDCIVFRTRA